MDSRVKLELLEILVMADLDCLAALVYLVSKSIFHNVMLQS